MLISCSRSNNEQLLLTVPGLEKSVEIIRDEQGINHIYAQTQHDLFFAQGYAAAKDRLFQFEIWRRRATGTVSEILGERELKRDIGARLFKFRGDLNKELNHYHPDGEAIITAFTDGVNAYIREIEKNPDALPLEFKLLGIKPGYWTPADVISRHQGLLGNMEDELVIARAVALLGVNKVKELSVFEPGDPVLDLDQSIIHEGLFENILELYDAYRKNITFTPEDLLAHANPSTINFHALVLDDLKAHEEIKEASLRTIGSNNWIVSGKKSVTGLPLLANDPHRALAIPSLRYMVHLHAPGWNVIGGGEPTIPGVSIGHNEHGAWGLTIFDIDGEDLMVYDIDPNNQNRYRFRNGWEEMTILKDTIKVKGSADVYVDHRYTLHGPVTFVDTKRSKAYAVRCAWLEPGGAPYLASLRMDVAKTWDEFKNACSFSHIPGENMVWADKEGNIGWQVVGIAPVRKNWSGLVPVPGDGRFEWDGYLPIKQLPSLSNPDKGFWATANENLVPLNYNHRYAVGWEWADSSRAKRVNVVLESKEKLSVDDMKKLQVDYVSMPAQQLVPMLKKIEFNDSIQAYLQSRMQNWNYSLDAESIEAAVYIAWEREILKQAHLIFVPQQAQQIIKTVPLRRVIQWIKADRPELKGKDNFLAQCYSLAINSLKEKLGDDLVNWKYGQTAYHHVLIKHPLSNAVNDSLRSILNCGPLPRGGSGFTPGMTGNGDNQTSGASFRMVADLSDLENTWFINSPGQSGDIHSRFYSNLFVPWANDRYFKATNLKKKILKNRTEHSILKPQ